MSASRSPCLIQVWYFLKITFCFHLFYILTTFPYFLCFCSLSLPSIYLPPHPLLVHLCSERGRPPLGINKAWGIKLRQDQARPLHQGWARVIGSQKPVQVPRTGPDLIARSPTNRPSLEFPKKADVMSNFIINFHL